MRRATLTSCAMALVLGLAVAPTVAGAQEPAHVWLAEAAARGVAEHASARDSISAMAESGAFDQAMTDWLRETAAYHARQVLQNEKLAAAAEAMKAEADPKATAPSQALQQWLAEQEAQRARDDRQARRLAAGESDASGAATFAAVRSQNATLAAQRVAGFQRWTTVVVDSTGEVIVNDRMDVQEARLQDLVRRQLEREAQARRTLDAEIEKQLDGRLRTLHRDFDRARSEIGAPSAAPTPQNIRQAIVAFEDCAEDLRQAMAALDAARGDYSDCLDRHHGADDPRELCIAYDRVTEQRTRQADQVDVRCLPLGEEVNRLIAQPQLAAAQGRLKAMGIDPAPLEPPSPPPPPPESLEDLELVPLVEPSPPPPPPAQSVEDLELAPLTEAPPASGEGAEAASADLDDLTLVPLIP